MSDALREGLSAVMDGEGDELTLRRLLARSDDPELRGAWARYHLARDALRDGVGLRPARDLAGAVRAAVDEEGQRRAPRRGAWRAVASFAVAASVTAVVVLGGRELTGVGDPAAPLAAPAGLVNNIGAAPVRASFGTRAQPPSRPGATSAYEQLARERLQLFSQEHAEHAALNTPQGLIPFARVPELDQP